jgi:hypothetical protein
MEMLLGGGRKRIGAAVALAAVLAMVLAAPAGAAGWGEERSWAGGLYQQVLAWLGFSQSTGVAVKCDQESQVDPNGCPRVLTKQGPHIDPNGSHTMSLTVTDTTDQGPHIDPNGHS